MSTKQLALSLSIILVAFAALWMFLALHQAGLLTSIERLGLHIAAWARSQKWAKERRKEEYGRLCAEPMKEAETYVR